MVVRYVLAALVGEREVLALADRNTDLSKAACTQRGVHERHLVVREAVWHGAVAPIQRPEEGAVSGSLARVKVAPLLVQQLLHEHVLVFAEQGLWGKRRGWDPSQARVDLEHELGEGQPLVATPAGQSRFEFVERVAAIEKDRLGVGRASDPVARVVRGIQRVMVLLAEEELGARRAGVSRAGGVVAGWRIEREARCGGESEGQRV